MARRGCSKSKEGDEEQRGIPEDSEERRNWEAFSENAIAKSR